jgi:acyl-coenzyme A thioesterase PaaI-like protein
MTDSDSDPDTTDEELVAAIREVGRVAHTHETTATVRNDAAALLREAAALLRDGPPRLRWYEVDEGHTDATRARNRELSTFSGSLNPVAPPMAISTGTLEDGRPALVGVVRLDRLREGPPRSAHGGVLAGLFDELLGGGQRLNGGPPGVTGRLTVRYRRPTPLGVDLRLRVWIHDERKRRVTVRGDCVVVGEDARPTAEAEAVFLRVDFEQLGAMMRHGADGTTDAPAPRTADD